MNEPHNPADPFGWFAQLGLGHQQWATLMRSTVQGSPLDERSKSQWDFALRQVIDATSPKNWLATNPEALKLAIESGGASLVEGTRLFLADLAKGRITMSDDQAFEVGRDLATTPGQRRVRERADAADPVRAEHAEGPQRPLLSSCRRASTSSTSSTCSPRTRFVALRRGAGPHGVPGLVAQRRRRAGASHLGRLRRERRAAGASPSRAASAGADKVNTLGFCVGGTLLASALAVLAARGEDPAASVTLLTTMLDFSDTGELGLMVDETGGRGARNAHRRRRRCCTGASSRRCSPRCAPTI